jgi:ABC-type Na+ transport system ATPase subunit NatA
VAARPPEAASVYERLSAEDLLLFCGPMHGLSFESAKSRTDELLASTASTRPASARFATFFSN